MDHDTDVTQGRPSGGGMQTRSKAASGKRSRGRTKKSTPSGLRGPRAPASAARTTPSGVIDAETIGAQGAADAKVCTPVPISLAGLGEQDRTRRVTVSVPTAAGTGPDASDVSPRTRRTRGLTRPNASTASWDGPGQPRTAPSCRRRPTFGRSPPTGESVYHITVHAFKVDFRLKIFSVSGGAAWGDRVRVRIYSDPIPVAAPPAFTGTSFSPSRSSCMISHLPLGLSGRIGTILPS